MPVGHTGGASRSPGRDGMAQGNPSSSVNSQDSSYSDRRLAALCEATLGRGRHVTTLDGGGRRGTGGDGGERRGTGGDGGELSVTAGNYGGRPIFTQPPAVPRSPPYSLTSICLIL